MIDLKEKVSEFLGCFQKPVVQIQKDDEGRQVYAVRDGYSVKSEEFQYHKYQEKNSRKMLALHVVALESYFKALQEHKTIMTKQFFNLDMGSLFAILDYSNEGDRAEKREKIKLTLLWMEPFNTINRLVNDKCSVEPKTLANLLMQVREFFPAIDPGVVGALLNLKMSKEIELCSEDLNKSFIMAVSIRGNKKETVDLLKEVPFEVPVYSAFPDIMMRMKIRLELVDTKDGKPGFVLHWDRKELDFIDFRKRLQERIDSVAAEYDCQDIPVYEI